MQAPRLKLTYQGQPRYLLPKQMPVNLGRLPENHVQMATDWVSGRHGRIQYTNGGFQYTDLNSTNGTYLEAPDGEVRFVRNQTIDLPASGKLSLGKQNDLPVHFEMGPVAGPSPPGLNAGIAALKSEDLDAAAEIFDTLIQVGPANAAPYYYAGYCAARAGNRRKAIVRLEQYRLLRPDDARVWMDLGRIYEKSGQFPEAENCYGKVLGMVPGLASAQRALRRLSQWQGDPAVSRNANTRRLLGTKPEFIESHDHFRVEYRLGYHLDILKRILKALEITHRWFGRTMDFSPVRKIPVRIHPPNGSASGITTPSGIELRVGAAHAKEENFLSLLAAHEYTHFALGSLTGFSVTVPWWLHEGLAQWVSNRLWPNATDVLECLAQSGASHRLIPLASLEVNVTDLLNADLPHVEMRSITRAAIDNAYIQAHGAVAFLFDTCRRSDIVNLIHALGCGRSIGDALGVIGVCYERLDVDLKEWIAAASPSDPHDRTQEIKPHKDKWYDRPH